MASQGEGSTMLAIDVGGTKIAYGLVQSDGTVSNDGVVYAIGARKNTSIAVRCGGRGDVTDTHVLWRVSKGSNVSSPVYIDGYLYWFHEKNEEI